jgi:hypothetical protein
LESHFLCLPHFEPVFHQEEPFVTYFMGAWVGEYLTRA